MHFNYDGNCDGEAVSLFMVQRLYILRCGEQTIRLTPLTMSVISSGAMRAICTDMDDLHRRDEGGLHRHG